MLSDDAPQVGCLRLGDAHPDGRPAGLDADIGVGQAALVRLDPDPLSINVTLTEDWLIPSM
jgi:hypothetical protein